MKNGLNLLKSIATALLGFGLIFAVGFVGACIINDIGNKYLERCLICFILCVLSLVVLLYATKTQDKRTNKSDTLAIVSITAMLVFILTGIITSIIMIRYIGFCVKYIVANDVLWIGMIFVGFLVCTLSSSLLFWVVENIVDH